MSEKPIERVWLPKVGDRAELKLPQPKDRACPKCGYRIAQLVVDMARLNFKCPRCHQHKLSEFVRIER